MGALRRLRLPLGEIGIARGLLLAELFLEGRNLCRRKFLPRARMPALDASAVAVILKPSGRNTV